MNQAADETPQVRCNSHLVLHLLLVAICAEAEKLVELDVWTGGRAAEVEGK